jgi:hypothetical protein
MLPISYRVHNDFSKIPIENWEAVSKTNSLKPLVKRGVTPKNIRDVWHGLQDQYTERYGVTKDFQDYIDLIKQAINAKAKFIDTGKRSLLNSIEIMDIDIKSKESQSHPLELKNIIPKLNKEGYKVSYQMPARDFFDIVNSAQNG